MSHEDRDDRHDGRDFPDGPQGGSRRGDKAAEGLTPPGREEEIPEPLKLVLTDLRASPEDAVRIVPAAGPVAGLRHAPHRGSSEEVDQAQRAQDRDHGERECVLLPACDGRSEEHVSPVFPHEPRKRPFLISPPGHTGAEAAHRGSEILIGIGILVVGLAILAPLSTRLNKRYPEPELAASDPQ